MFLEEIKGHFQAKYVGKIQSALPYEMNSDFAQVYYYCFILL